jgi:protein-tyrosine-phosphatase
MARSVLFVCYGNTCRSPLAAALAEARIGGLKAESAGLAPGGRVSAHSVAVASRRAGADLSSHVPRDMGGIDLSRFDLVVALDDTVGAHLAGEVDEGRLMVWDVVDPVGARSAPMSMRPTRLSCT